MRLVNLLFDEEYENVDILSVPDDIADNIDNIAQEFTRWIWFPENRQQFMVTLSDGKECLSFDTKEFLWWLNNIFLSPGQTAAIYLQHTSFHPEHPTANF